MTKLSRSKIDLFVECPRCFWLNLKKGIKRPSPPPYTINNAIDYLLKQEFDVYRKEGKPHPVMVENRIDAVPFDTPEMSKWRHNFTGVQYEHKSTGFLITGAVDDVWVNPQEELIVVDYKATGANQHQIYPSYKRQLEVYQWLLRGNGFQVSDTGYFVFARVNKANGFSHGHSDSHSHGTLPFDLFVESQEGDGAWIEGTLLAAKAALGSETCPAPSAECEYCAYRRGAIEFSQT